MKLLCEAFVQDRDSVSITNRQRQTFVKSTIALGIKPKSDDDSPKKSMVLMVFTPQNPSGVLYKISEISNIFTRFIAEGRATICFHQPKHDILIKSDALQLRSLLTKIKMGIEGKTSTEIGSLATVATTGVARKDFPIRKLKIHKPSDYPANGLPRGLTELTIVGINKMRIDTPILSMLNLTSLNFSNNRLTEIPEELGRLRLKYIDFSGNKLANCDWRWLAKQQISKSLLHLNMSNNQLEILPTLIWRLPELQTLNVSNNNLTLVPFAVRRATKLVYLYLSNNQLNAIPTASYFGRMYVLDITNNPFKYTKNPEYHEPRLCNGPNTAESLLQLAARKVFRSRINFRRANIPRFMVNELLESPLCQTCGTIVYPKNGMLRLMQFSFPQNKIQVILKDNSTGLNGLSYFCSPKCPK